MKISVNDLAHSKGVPTAATEAMLLMQDRIEALTAEVERLRARIAKDIEVELSMCAIANEEASGEWIDGFDFAWKRVRAALGDTQ